MTKSKYEEAQDLMVTVDDQDEIAAKVFVQVALTMENMSAREAEQRVAAAIGHLPSVIRCLPQRPATFDEKLSHMASGHGGGTPPFINGHELERLKRYVDVPCWRIEYLDSIKAKLAPEQIADYPHNSDFPNGLVHDESCRDCKGSGTRKQDETRGWKCRYCDLEYEDQSEFYRTNCLMEMGNTKAFVDEWRWEHEAGEHAMDRPGCPLCAEDRMKQKAAQQRRHRKSYD